jgi:hypothetical protein
MEEIDPNDLTIRGQQVGSIAIEMKQTRIPPKKAKRKQSPRHGPGRLTMKR